MGESNVSVIVPIYKVEDFIEKCVESLMNQTLSDVEYIFVDDASPDNSIPILKKCINKYPHRNIKIAHHNQNLGLPAARNTGLALATGEYIFHCDSDDFVELDMLESMYRIAKNQNADIIWCDWYLSFKSNERYMIQPEYKTPCDALKGMLAGNMKYNVWNKLIKRTLYTDNHINFPAGYGMGEDMTVIMLFSYAKRVVYLPKAFYHYVKLNSGAFSQTYSSNHLIELKYNVQRIESFLQMKYGDSFKEYIAFFKLNVKYPFLISNNQKWYDLWKLWYPEANPFIWKNRNISLRIRLVQWCACKEFYWLLKLYFVIIHKFIYGVIYK